MNTLMLLLSMSHTKVCLFLDIFSSIVDKIWHFNKIAPVENGEKGVKMDFSRSHNFQLRYRIRE
jgi:hypothetical protein